MLSDKKLCTKLQETYNANVLKNGRKPTREFFISTAQTAKKLNITIHTHSEEVLNYKILKLLELVLCDMHDAFNIL